MTTLRSIHKYMNQRLHVRLSDGRVGKIVRVDTTFPANDTLVTLWTDTPSGPGVMKVRLNEVVGSVRLAAAGLSSGADPSAAKA